MNITRRRVAGLAAALALAAGGAAAAVAGPATHDIAAPAVHAGTHYSAKAVEAKASLLQYLKKDKSWDIPAPGGGPHKVTPSTTNLTAGARGTSTVGSYNWSGYADSSSTANTFTAVSATWAQPATSCTPEQELTAFWVGLDGYATDTVEQDGTLDYCFEGQAYYYTWWEMYPGNSVTVGSTVRPGDLISASVTRSGTSYTLSLTDFNNPSNSFSTTQSCLPAGTCLNESAEWIAERPAFPIGITPLAYFNVWAPFNASETANSIKGSISSGPGATGIVIVDATDTYQLDNISGLSFGGTSFTSHWLNSY